MMRILKMSVVALIFMTSTGIAETVSSAPAGEQKHEVRILTLENCIKEGLAKYQGIKAAELDKLWAEAKLSEAKTARFLPKFDATSLFGPVPDLPAGYGPPAFPSYETDLGKWNIFYRVKIELLQPLFTFGKLSNLINAAEEGVKAKDLQVQIEKRDLVHKIKTVYYGLVYAYTGLNLMDEVNDKISSAITRVEKLLKKNSSEVTELDLLKLKVFDADLKKRYIDVRDNLDIGKRALLILLGEPPDNGIEIDDKNLTQEDGQLKSMDDYYKLGMENRAELKQLASVVEIKKSLVNVAKSDFFPTFFIGGQFEYGVAPGREHISNPYLYDRFNMKNLGAALGMSQSLNFFLTNTRYRQAKAEYGKLLWQKEQASNALMLEVRKNYQEALSNKETIEVTRAGFKDARSWMTASYLNFDMGTTSTKDLIEAFAAYTKTKMEYTDSIFQYNMALSGLTRATGEEITKLKY